MIERVFIEATTLNDAWHQLLFAIVDKGHQYQVDAGSYAGQTRLEFDWVDIHVKYPGMRPLTPQIPEGLGIPVPCSEEYATKKYPLYLMTNDRNYNEAYTYGERLIGPNEKWPDTGTKYKTNQIQVVIDTFKRVGDGWNQGCMEIGMPDDCGTKDPPCLRLIDCRVRDGVLHFFMYFRSWDLWNGFPVNMAGLQILKEHMASEIGVDDGEIIVCSKGLHVYDHCFDVLKVRTYKEINS